MKNLLLVLCLTACSLFSTVASAQKFDDLVLRVCAEKQPGTFGSRTTYTVRFWTTLGMTNYTSEQWHRIDLIWDDGQYVCGSGIRLKPLQELRARVLMEPLAGLPGDPGEAAAMIRIESVYTSQLPFNDAFVNQRVNLSGDILLYWNSDKGHYKNGGFLLAPNT